MTVTPKPPALLTPSQVSDFLSVPVETLRKWRQAGTGPAFAKLGRHVRYAQADVDGWLADQQQAARTAAAI